MVVVRVGGAKHQLFIHEVPGRVQTVGGGWVGLAGLR